MLALKKSKANNHRIQRPSLYGGILLVLGNVIGAGIIALPIAVLDLGLPLAISVLILFWFLMLTGAFYYLEVNLTFPAGTNLISMARISLGRWGATVAWFCNLIVMYSLISAYIAGGGDLIQVNLQRIGVSSPISLGYILFLLIFGGFVVLGMRRVDYINRYLMVLKFIIFFSILHGIMPKISAQNTFFYPFQQVSISLLIIVLTSYGFATIVPSLRTYYQNDVKRIKLVMLWGMVIALICYLIWVIVIFCLFTSHEQLHRLVDSSHPVSDLQAILTQTLKIPWITQQMNIFSSICIITSFLTNSISLTDFMKDGLQFYKKKQKVLLVYLISYGPPLLVVLFYPKIFLMGLSVAGELAIVLLLLLPTMMVRRVRLLAVQDHGIQQTFLSQLLMHIVLIVSFGLLVSAGLNNLSW